MNSRPFARTAMLELQESASPFWRAPEVRLWAVPDSRNRKRAARGDAADAPVEGSVRTKFRPSLLGSEPSLLGQLCSLLIKKQFPAPLRRDPGDGFAGDCVRHHPFRTNQALSAWPRD